MSLPRAEVEALKIKLSNAQRNALLRKSDFEDIRKAIVDATGKSPEDVRVVIGEKVSKLVHTGVPQQLTYGFAAGACSGFALVKVGKIAATGLGLCFMLLQGLAYSGFIVVDQEKIQSRFQRALDLNGDGKIDDKDMDEIGSRITNVLAYNLPAGTGFVPGLLLGMRRG